MRSWRRLDSEFVAIVLARSSVAEVCDLGRQDVEHQADPSSRIVVISPTSQRSATDGEFNGRVRPWNLQFIRRLSALTISRGALNASAPYVGFQINGNESGALTSARQGRAAKCDFAQARRRPQNLGLGRGPVQ